MTERASALPPHIAAALGAVGGVADTAGQPWAGRDLADRDGVKPYHRFDADDGSQDAGLRAALAALRAGNGGEAEVVASLATARVFVPIVATASEGGEREAAERGTAETANSTDPDDQHGHQRRDTSGSATHGDKESDMALVTVMAPDGRRALPIFSSTEKLSAWHRQARPVAVFAARAALSAVSEEAQLMVLDPGAELTFVVRRPALWALAQQHSWTPSYADGELRAEVHGVLERVALELSRRTARLDAPVGTDEFPLFLGMDLLPGSGVHSKSADGSALSGGGPGPELRLVLLLREGLSTNDLEVFVAAVQEALSSNERFANQVDSLEISLHSATAENNGPGQTGWQI